MAIFRKKDAAKRRLHKQAHDAAVTAALDCYSFWGNAPTAYETYVETMQAWGARPVAYSVFHGELPRK